MGSEGAALSPPLPAPRLPPLPGARGCGEDMAGTALDVAGKEARARIGGPTAPGPTRPPPGWCLMFSVEPTLARTFFRSGMDALVAGRLSLGAEELGLADVGFLSTARVPEGRGDTGVGLTRPGAAPAGEAAPGPVAVFLAVLLELLFARLRSAGRWEWETRVQGREPTGAGKPRRRGG